jgi:hypothetical protein
LDFQLSFLVVMKKKLESSGVLQFAQSVWEVSCPLLLFSAVLHLLAVHPDVVLVVAITEVLWDSVSLSTSWCVSKWRFWDRICSYDAVNTLVIWVSLLSWNKMRNWSSASSWWPLQINPCRFESCSPNGLLVTGHQRGYMWILHCK